MKLSWLHHLHKRGTVLENIWFLIFKKVKRFNLVHFGEKHLITNLKIRLHSPLTIPKRYQKTDDIITA